MYNKEQIKKLAREYVETGDEQVFEVLIKALIPVIDVQLGKSYSSLKEFWDDLKQEVLLKLWKNRRGLLTTKSTSLYQFLYRRIHRDLFRAAKKIKGEFDEEKDIIKPGYDGYNPYVMYLEDLSMKEKIKLGIEPIEEEDYD